jgi:meiotic recombination protein SPO11
LGHEENINTRQLQWLGIRSRDLLSSCQKIDGPDHSQRIGIGDTLQSRPALSRHNSLSLFSSGGPSSQRQASQDRISPNATNSQRLSHFESSPQESLTPLTIRDRKAAVNLLSKIHDTEGGNDARDMEEIQELQAMLMLNIKAEIQAADNLGDMTEWLDGKLVV